MHRHLPITGPKHGRGAPLAIGAMLAFMLPFQAHGLPEMPVMESGIIVSDAIHPPLPVMHLPPAMPRLWANLTPEEREHMRGQIREHWERMPPEERQRRRDLFRGQREGGGPPPGALPRRDPWQRVSPEERQQIRDMIRERRGPEPVRNRE